MRAVKDKYGNLQIIDRSQTSLFNKADLHKFLDISTLNERDLCVCEDLHKRNIFQKIKKGHKVGYRSYSQQSIV